VNSLEGCYTVSHRNVTVSQESRPAPSSPGVTRFPHARSRRNPKRDLAGGYIRGF
jgi:hypothetical protein